MNVTYVTAGIVPIHSDLGGGIERHIRAVTTELERRGHSVSIVDRQYSSTDPETYAGILTIAILGYLLNKAVVLVQRRVLHWSERQTM